VTEDEHIERARKLLANISETGAPAPEAAVPQSPEVNNEDHKRDGVPSERPSDVVLTPDTELEVMAVVDKKSRRTRAKEAFIRAAKRMEEGALNAVASVIVGGKKVEQNNRYSAVKSRIAVVEKDLARIPAEVLARQDEQSAGWYESQHLYLEPPVQARSIDQEILYAKWEERRTPQDPEVAAAVRSAEAPVQEQIDAIIATELYGVPFVVRNQAGEESTPWEYRGTPYESKPGDPRAEHYEETMSNNRKLMRLVGEKLAARKRVLDQYKS
jgi:hypothetical protein